MRVGINKYPPPPVAFVPYTITLYIDNRGDDQALRDHVASSVSHGSLTGRRMQETLDNADRSVVH